MWGALLIILIFIYVPLMVRLQSFKFVNGAFLTCCKYHCRDVLWGIIISFPFAKEGPMLKEIWKEALKQLS